MFLGPVVADAVGAHELAVEGDLDRVGDDRDLDLASLVGVADSIGVPAKLTLPLLSTLRVTATLAGRARSARRNVGSLSVGWRRAWVATSTPPW